MFWFVLFVMLAAFGLLCALWVSFGWLLPGIHPGVIVFFCRPGAVEDGAITRYCWLRELGFVQSTMLIVDSALPLSTRERLCRQHRGIKFCSLEELPSRLELERDQLD